MENYIANSGGHIPGQDFKIYDVIVEDHFIAILYSRVCLKVELIFKGENGEYKNTKQTALFRVGNHNMKKNTILLHDKRLFAFTKSLYDGDEIWILEDNGWERIWSKRTGPGIVKADQIDYGISKSQGLAERIIKNIRE